MTQTSSRQPAGECEAIVVTSSAHLDCTQFSFGHKVCVRVASHQYNTSHTPLTLITMAAVTDPMFASLVENSAQLAVFRVRQLGLARVAAADWGSFYSGDCYLVHDGRHGGAHIHYWIGGGYITETDTLNTSSRLTDQDPSPARTSRPWPPSRPWSWTTCSEVCPCSTGRWRATSPQDSSKYYLPMLVSF